MRFAPNEFYHVYNRGVEGRDIFLNARDYQRFIKGLIIFNQVDAPVQLSRFDPSSIKVKMGSQQQPLASILSYVLMKNHVHLLVRCHNEVALAKLLQKLFIGYTMFFNLKYNRKGVLFQSGSKSKHINNQRYLAHMISYIHLNPLDYKLPNWRAHGITNIPLAKKFIVEYPWSSIKGILGNYTDPILNKELLNELFPNPEEFLPGMLEWSSETFERVSDLCLD